MFSEEHLYSIALRRCKNIGDIHFQKLVYAFGSATSVWNAPRKELLEITGVSNGIISEIGKEEHLKFAENELNFCEKNNVKIRLRHQSELPFFLSECADAPAILYQKGDFNERLTPLSIVGTRNITAYGKTFVRDFLEETKRFKIITISGLAYGVDTEVHQQSLDRNIPTIAVLAHGFHMLYPSKNKILAEKIIEQGGALFTEFNTSQKPDREHFIQRNRVVAGLSPNLIVVETAYGGGSISTATFANGYNREVYALPGRITDKYSQGCNHLIFQNKAVAISGLKMLIDNLQLDKTEIIPELFPNPKVEVSLPEIQQKIYDIIHQNTNIHLDDLAEKLELNSFEILPDLLELEILGHIKADSGRHFSIL